MITDLNPPEDYKSVICAFILIFERQSVLAGLRPDTITEIITRAISFWSYQVSQEFCYQEALRNALEDKNLRLEKNVTSLITEANNEIHTLRERLSAVQKELELEKRKSHEISEQFAEKSRQYQKLKVYQPPSVVNLDLCQSMCDRIRGQNLHHSILQQQNHQQHNHQQHNHQQQIPLSSLDLERNNSAPRRNNNFIPGDMRRHAYDVSPMLRDKVFGNSRPVTVPAYNANRGGNFSLSALFTFTLGQ